MTKDISYLPPEERKHFHHCEYCENYYDRRDLGEVFLHAEGDCVKGEEKPRVEFGEALRNGDSEEFFNDDTTTRINLN